MNEAEVEKIACYTRFTRHVVELVPVEHSSLRSSCSKPSCSSCATRITITNSELF
jgi:hypothetical protein